MQVSKSEIVRRVAASLGLKVINIPLVVNLKPVELVKIEGVWQMPKEGGTDGD